MKKGWILGLGFVFLFLFVQSFVLAVDNSSGLNVEYKRSVSHVFLITVLFEPVSVVTVSSCSVYLNSSNQSFQRTLAEVNVSKVNRISVSNLSAGTNYNGQVVCFDSNNNRGESSIFTVNTNNRSVVEKNTPIISHQISHVNINNLSNQVEQPVVEDSSSIKRFLMGVFAGFGILLILIGAGYFIWKFNSK